MGLFDVLGKAKRKRKGKKRVKDARSWSATVGKKHRTSRKVAGVRKSRRRKKTITDINF